MKQFSTTLIGSILAGTLAVTAGGAAWAKHHEERGPLTREAAMAKADKAFAKMDANQDGQIDKADHEAKLAERFARMDTDGNGAIDRDEFTTAHEKRRAKRAGKREMRGEHRAHRGGHHRRGMGRRLLKQADANQDRIVTQAEFQQAALARFDQADTDNNGAISQAEREAAREKRREKHRMMRQRSDAS